MLKRNKEFRFSKTVFVVTEELTERGFLQCKSVMRNANAMSAHFWHSIFHYILQIKSQFSSAQSAPLNLSFSGTMLVTLSLSLSFEMSAFCFGAWNIFAGYKILIVSFGALQTFYTEFYHAVIHIFFLCMINVLSISHSSKNFSVFSLTGFKGRA